MTQALMVDIKVEVHIMGFKMGTKLLIVED
jgi:hypothetical protein